MLQKRPRIQPMNWSLTALLLAACGGAGRGGTPVTTFTREGSEGGLALAANSENVETNPKTVTFIETQVNDLSASMEENVIRFAAEELMSPKLRACVWFIFFLRPAHRSAPDRFCAIGVFDLLTK